LKKLVLFGAFDRYNYGDNLMPIVFMRYIEKYQPQILQDYEVEYSAISQSNLQNYDCVKSSKINSIINKLEPGSAIIVIGGEILCGTNADLFLHMQSSSFTHNLALAFKKNFTKLFNLYSRLQYSTKWDYPFIIDKAYLPTGVKVLYNTIGGQINPNNKPLYQKITKRIIDADYFSVRDSRTLNQLDNIRDVSLSPDSVFLLPDVISEEFLQKHVKPDIYLLKNEEPKFVIQAAPSKIDCSEDEFIEQIKLLANHSQSKIILLPIGYASGHDDVPLLTKINKILPDNTILLKDLNVWEILFVIKSAKAFMGTSLHGVITAMTYGLPHFGLNVNIGKLNAFLQEWSVAPYNKCYSVNNIANLPQLIKECSPELQNNANNIIERIKNNNAKMIEVITSSHQQ
jgi:polysaccharide pyruvyl transferase WcaK-like protein